MFTIPSHDGHGNGMAAAAAAAAQRHTSYNLTVFCSCAVAILDTRDHSTGPCIYVFANLSARAGCDSRSIFKRNLTDFNSEFSFS